MIYDHDELDRLAWTIDAEGIARHEAAATALVAQARDAGMTTALLDVLADATAPAPVRERAFGKVVHALTALPAGAEREWALAN